MRVALLVALLLPGALYAQTAGPVTIPTQGIWVGPLEFNNGSQQLVAPTVTTITFTDANTFHGDFSPVRPATISGTFDGTIDSKGRMRVTLKLSGNGETQSESGDETTIVERCAAEGVLEGTITESGVLRWAARQLRSDTPRNRAANRACTNPTRVMWTLQRDEH